MKEGKKGLRKERGKVDREEKEGDSPGLFPLRNHAFQKINSVLVGLLIHLTRISCFLFHGSPFFPFFSWKVRVVDRGCDSSPRTGLERTRATSSRGRGVR